MDLLNFAASLVTLGIYPAARRLHRLLVPPRPATLGRLYHRDARASDYILVELYR